MSQNAQLVLRPTPMAPAASPYSPQSDGLRRDAIFERSDGIILTPCIAGSLARRSVEPRIGIALDNDGLLESRSGLPPADFAPGAALCSSCFLSRTVI